MSWYPVHQSQRFGPSIIFTMPVFVLVILYWPVIINKKYYFNQINEHQLSFNFKPLGAMELRLCVYKRWKNRHGQSPSSIAINENFNVVPNVTVLRLWVGLWLCFCLFVTDFDSINVWLVSGYQCGINQRLLILEYQSPTWFNFTWKDGYKRFSMCTISWHRE